MSQVGKTDTCLAVLAFYAFALSIPGLQPAAAEG